MESDINLSDPFPPTFNTDLIDLNNRLYTMSKKIMNRISNYEYFFVKPAAKENVHETARKLIELERIKEVFITEGDYGFVVKANLLYSEAADSLNAEIKKIVGGSSTKVACLCQYSKK